MLDLMWTQALVHELVSQGVTYFCLSPGSRSTPLVLALSVHPHVEAFVHFDERAMAFHALGYAKAANKPAAIIVTSGTAAGNLLPAIMEAHESSIPLIILTADRPSELQECGANQTTYQVHMFQNYVRWQHSFPSPDPACSIEYVKTTVAHAVAQATLHHPGPVHLNCPFREPFALTTSSSVEHLAVPTPKTHLLPFERMLGQDTLHLLSSLINTSPQGMIVLGYEGLDSADLPSFYALVDLLHWPIFCDPLSQGRSHDNTIARYDLLCSLLKSNKTSMDSLHPHCVLHFGGACVSQNLMNFLTSAPPKTYIHVSALEKRQDPMHLVTHRVFTSPKTLCSQLLATITPKSYGAYLQEWRHLDVRASTTVAAIFTGEHPLSEPELLDHLSRYDFSHYDVFVSSSMPIRNLLQFFHPKMPPKHIYGNRGLSGIDGNIATTLGIAKASRSPIISILGDQTFLHDLTSLSQLKTLKTPALFLVINNGGGNIFSWLPIYTYQELCEAYFINPHDFHFEKIAAWFGLAYTRCFSLHDFAKSFTLAQNSSRHHLIEVTTERDTDLSMHHRIQQHLIEHAQYTFSGK